MRLGEVGPDAAWREHLPRGSYRETLIYIRLITTAVRSSCCSVPSENSTTVRYRVEMSSLGDFSFDCRITSPDRLTPNGSPLGFAHSKNPSVARTSRSPGCISRISGGADTKF